MTSRVEQREVEIMRGEKVNRVRGGEEKSQSGGEGNSWLGVEYERRRVVEDENR